MIMVKIIWTLGRQHRNMVEYSNLCLISSVLHVSSQLFHQNLDGQMDAACVHVLLYNLHMHAVLSRVLYHYPRSNFRWNRRCSDVECQMYLFDTGEKIWKNTIKLSLIGNFSMENVYMHIVHPSYYSDRREVCQAYFGWCWVHHRQILWYLFSLLPKLICLGKSN